MMDPRPFGLIVVVVGLIGTLIAAFADPLGIGEGEVFGWLQITGVIIGGVVTLLGLAIAMEWVPYPARRDDTTTGSSQNTTVIE
jgi:hypothetical protein